MSETQKAYVGEQFYSCKQPLTRVHKKLFVEAESLPQGTFVSLVLTKLHFRQMFAVSVTLVTRGTLWKVPWQDSIIKV